MMIEGRSPMLSMRHIEASDFFELAIWWRTHEKTPLKEEQRPEHGIIVPGVAAGFIYLTDGDLAILEHYVTNPLASSEDRHEALDEITKGLTVIAKRAGKGRVVASVQDAGFLDRSVRDHGFRHLGTFTYIGKMI